MSYDFSLRLPAALRKRKGKLGPHPEQVLRLQRAREIFLAFEPDVAIDDDNGMFTVFSAELGDVFVSYDRIALSLSMGADARVVYAAIHGLMKRFRGEGYEASDPQIGGAIVYHQSFADFMAQYRRQFRCNDEEFAQWCSGVEPPAWAQQRALRERGDALAATALPQCDWDLSWQQRKDLADDALWPHLLDVVRRNDAAISTHGLGEYLQLLSMKASIDARYGSRRLDGSYYPNSVDVNWFQGSLLHYEAIILGELKQRGYAAAVRDQPQRVSLVFDLAADQPISQAHMDAARAAVLPAYSELLQAGLIEHSVDGAGQGNAHIYHFHGDDADAIHAALTQSFAEPSRYQPARIAKRYGELGAREVELSFVPSSPH